MASAPRPSIPSRLPFASLLLLLVPTSLAKPHKSYLVLNAEPSEVSVHERRLVTEHIHYKSILFEHSRHWSNVSHRHFNGTVLAYVTPWNTKGYDVAIKFRNKFTHVSPVWYQLKGESSGPELGGGDAENRAWILRLRAAGSTTKLVPRFMLEGPHILEMMKSEEHSARAIELMVNECKSRGFDGLVLEAWSSWVHAGVLEKPKLRKKALDFIKTLAQELQAQDPPLETFLVVAPPGSGGEPSHVFSSLDLTSLAPYVAGFSLMTYDFSNPYNPGPNAPMKWIQACLAYLLPQVRPKHVEELHHYSRELRSVDAEAASEDEIAAKVLLGLNFYGNRFQKPTGGGPIVGHEYLDLVDKHHPSLKWDEHSKEHHFTFKTETGSQHEVYYPTLHSVQARLEEAKAWGTGISIWEIGQGLDFFYDLL